MRTVISFAAIMLLGWAQSVIAALPEPNITFYGKVFNRYHGSDLPVESGELRWRLRDLATQQQYIYSTSLGRIAAADESYNYRIDIPLALVESLSRLPSLRGEVVSGEDTLTLADEPRQLEFLSIQIDDQPASVITDSGEILTLLAGERSQHLRIDLQISRPFLDSDGDGLPDAWEIRYYGCATCAKADEDSDGDGLTALQEYALTTDPSIDNRRPMVVQDRLVLYEQGVKQFNPSIVDADTAATALEVVVVAIPADLQLIYHGFGDRYPAGHSLAVNDTLTHEDLLAGRVILRHTPQLGIDAQAERATVDPLVLRLVDGEHEPVDAVVMIDLLSPQRLVRSGVQMWFDSSVNPDYFSRYDDPDYDHWDAREEWYGRSRRHIAVDAFRNTDATGWNGLDVAREPAGPRGQQVIRLAGDSYLESWDQTWDEEYRAFDLKAGTALFALFRSAAESEQILVADLRAELAINGTHGAYPGRLRFSREGKGDLYSAMAVGNDWGIAGLFLDEKGGRIDWNGRLAGVEGEDIAASDVGSWPTSRSLGGKMKGSAYESGYQLVKPFKGHLAEILALNCGLCLAEKWRIYGYLYSKWFDYLLVDHSATTHNTVVASATASRLSFYQQYGEEGEPIYDGLDDFIYYNGDYERPPLGLQGEFAHEMAEIRQQYGDDFAYFLIGGSAFDRLTGGPNDDFLIGSAGGDWLTGLTGADTFVVVDGNKVVDFNPDEGDRLVFDHLLRVEDPQRPLQSYLRFERDFYTSYLMIDANGDGSGFNDATITLLSRDLQDGDIPRLWSMGALGSGTVTPQLQLTFVAPRSGAVVQELDTAPLSFTLRSSGAPLPHGFSLPIDISGSATLFEDYRLEIAAWDPLLVNGDGSLGGYSYRAVNSHSLPLDLPPGAHEVNLLLHGVSDSLHEGDERVDITLLPLGHYGRGDQPTLRLTISDGPAEVSLAATIPAVLEGSQQPGQFTLTRRGSLDVPLMVRIEIAGSAENGRDYSFVAQEQHFAAGSDRVNIDIYAVRDQLDEGIEYVELVLASGNGYRIAGQATARVALVDSATLDSDGDGLPDFWELRFGLNPSLADSDEDGDGDGLSNLREYQLGTSPILRDSDGDGVDDLHDIEPQNPANSARRAEVGEHQLQIGSGNLLQLVAGDTLSLPLTSRLLIDGHVANPSLAGLTLRIHYNSALLEWQGAEAILPLGSLTPNPQVVFDSDNQDGDEMTDRVVTLRWLHSEGDWPGKGDLLLARANFRVMEIPLELNSALRLSATAATSGFRIVTIPLTLMMRPLVALQLDEGVPPTAAREGQAVSRYLFGLRDSDANLNAAIVPALSSLDIDGNGRVDSLTDGLLYSRCLAGFSGAALVTGAVANDASRRSGESVTHYCQALMAAGATP
jgi:hypothetical protein